MTDDKSSGGCQGYKNTNINIGNKQISHFSMKDGSVIRELAAARKDNLPVNVFLSAV